MKYKYKLNNDYDGHTIDSTFFHLHIPLNVKRVKKVNFKCHGWIHYEGQDETVEEEFTEEDITNISIHNGWIDMEVMAPSGIALPEYASLVVEFSYEQDNYMEVIVI